MTRRIPDRVGALRTRRRQERVPAPITIEPLYDPASTQGEGVKPHAVRSGPPRPDPHHRRRRHRHLGRLSSRTRGRARTCCWSRRRSSPHGCTWHAAGLVGQLRGKRNLTRLMQNSVAVFDRLEAETGQAIQWHKVGSLRLASSPDRWSEIRRSMTQAKSFGVECHALSADGGQGDVPLHHRRGWHRGRGLHRGRRLCRSLCADHGLCEGGARKRRQDRGRRDASPTSSSKAAARSASSPITARIGCDILVNCAGLWAKRVGEMAGVADRRRRRRAPVFPHREEADAADRSSRRCAIPTTISTSSPIPAASPSAAGRTARGAAGAACRRSISAASCSPPTWTGWSCSPCRRRSACRSSTRSASRPSSTARSRSRPTASRSSGSRPSSTISISPAASPRASPHRAAPAQAMANWILARRSRHGPLALRRAPLRAGPGAGPLPRRARHRGLWRLLQDPLAGRGAALRRAACGARRCTTGSMQAGAVFGSKFGWERPNWFAAPGEDAAWTSRASRASRTGSTRWRASTDAIRERVALIDQTSFAKFEISGKGALAALNRIAANDLSGPPGKAVYTQLCNDKGGIEADVTIVHSADDLLFVITGSGFGVRDSAWIQRHLPRDSRIQMRDVTECMRHDQPLRPAGARGSAVGQRRRSLQRGFSVPRRRGRSRSATPWSLACASAMSASSATSSTCRRNSPPMSTRRCGRRARSHGIANAGYRAIESCRLEKGYLYWSGDITPDYNPYEAGLGFAVELEQGNFIGHDALWRASRQNGVKRKLCSFTLDGFAPLHGGEPILLDGKVVGRRQRAPGSATRSARPSPSATCPSSWHANQTSRSRRSATAMRRNAASAASTTPRWSGSRREGRP